MGETYQSWGRFPKTSHEGVTIRWRHEDLPLDRGERRSLLPYGNGRSYGDSCLNDGGVLLDAKPLDHFLAFDRVQGIVRCEAGVLLADLLELIVPHGWFLPVTPGTKFVTVGGAVANDVHGKNHHRAGTFGCHVTAFDLLRSDGTRLRCSRHEHDDWFQATIGGLGLTGLILWVELQLKPISSPYLSVESIRYGGLSEFFDLSSESDASHEYTVAWLDCLARGRRLGRGYFYRANHTAARARSPVPRQKGLTVPVDLPFSPLNKVTLRLFNTVYYYHQLPRFRTDLWHYDPFFYPLDAIRSWNRLYGSSGFLQYQCLVPLDGGREAIRELLERVAASKRGSFLTVLKVFGSRPSPGMLSFPRPGITVALDFPYRGWETLDFLDSLDEIVLAAGGAVYPAKDARMSGMSFRRFFPQWKEFSRYIDPRFSSSFWRRVTREA